MNRRAYVVTGRGQVGLVEETLPPLGPGDVLVRTLRSAVSTGTEVFRFLNHGHYGGEGGPIGYNAVGQVLAVGSAVATLAVGDLVFALEGHADRFVVREGRAIKLPTAIDLDQAALCYLPTLGLHALRAAGYTIGQSVVVVGQGIVGVLAALVAQAAGAPTFALEVDPVRRSLAVAAGVRLVVDATSAVSVIAERQPEGPDIVIEASQAWAGLEGALDLARTDTTIACVGIYRSEPDATTSSRLLRATLMERDQFFDRRIRLIGCSNDPWEDEGRTGRWTLERNVRYVADQVVGGTLDLHGAITTRLPWTDLADIYRTLAEGDRSMLGIVLRWEQE